jgi:ammonia channel protein AmtB
MRYNPVVGAVADVTEYAGIVMVPLLLAAGVFAVIVSGVAALAGPDDRRMRFSHWLLAVVLGAFVIWLAFYAAGEDTYYGGGVSRWEHADRFVGSTRVAAAIAFGALTSMLLAASALVPERQSLRLLVAPTAAISCFFLFLAWFWLTGGH